MALAIVDLWNLALGHIGVSEVIATETADTALARACRRVWKPARNATFEIFDWAFARKMKAPVLLKQAPPLGWTYAYGLSVTNVAAIRQVLSRPLLEQGVSDARVPYELCSDPSDDDGRQLVIATHEAAPTVVYTKVITVPAFYPPLFVDVLSWRLAADLASTQTRAADVRESCLQAYQQALQLATRSQASQRFQLRPESSLITCRW